MSESIAALYPAHLEELKRRHDEALKLTREYADKTPVELTARLMTGAIRAKSPGAAAEQEVGAWLDAKAAASTNPIEPLSRGISSTRWNVLPVLGTVTCCVNDT